MHIGKKGFTLVEIIVSLAIMSIVAGAIGAFVIAGNNSYMRGNRELTLQEEAQLTANQLIDLIIDVERGISFQTTTGDAVNVDGGVEANGVPAAELILRNNDNVYMVRWQGGSGYDSANRLYLYEAANGGKDADGNIIWGDPETAAPSLMAEYVTAFNIDLTDLDKRKVKLEMTFSYQDKTYNISETIKLRNDLSGEESTDYAWITGLTIDPTSATLNQGAVQNFTYKLTGDEAAVARGVTWKVTKADGSSCKSNIDGNGKLTIASDEDPGDDVLLVTCTAVADPSKVATAVISVKKYSAFTLSIKPKAANVMQGQTQEFTYVFTALGENKEAVEEAQRQGVTWELEAMNGQTVANDTKLVNGILKVGRDQKEGTSVLRVICRSVADDSKWDSAIVNVLPYSVIDSKYDAKLIAENLTTYEFTQDGVEKVGFKGNIECLPSWADYTNGYPKITWSIPEDPTQSKYTITSNEGPDEQQFTATLKCWNQYDIHDPGVRVVANVKLSADIEVVLDIEIVVPKLETAMIADKPYINSDQFVLNRNDKITCWIENYTDENNKPKEVVWKIADLQSDLYSTCKHPGDNIVYRNNMVGLDPMNGENEPDDHPVNDTWDQDHGTMELTMEHTGTQTDVWAKYFIDMDEEYHFKLQAWSLDESELVAETTILVPKFDILFYNGEHVKEIGIPTSNAEIKVKFYGFTNTNVTLLHAQGVPLGDHTLVLDGKLQGEESMENVQFYTWGIHRDEPSVYVAVNDQPWTNIPQKNKYLILTFWDTENPKITRNLLLLLKKNYS